MKFILSIFISLCFSCNNIEKRKKFIKVQPIKIVHQKENSDSTEFLIAPYRIVPNMEITKIDSNKKIFKFGKHSLITFLENSNYLCSIDGKRVDYSSSVTINEVIKKKDSLNWTTYAIENIKYYKSDVEDKLLITLQSQPCMGKGCAINNFLIYDFKNKTENYFGAYRNYSNKTGNFYDFNKDGKFEFISQSFPNDLNCSNNCIYFYKIFLENEEGKFIPKTDSKRNPYYLQSSEEGSIISSNWF